MDKLKLYNSLTKEVEEVAPILDGTFRIYSCGPTVYNHAHIGNLSSFIIADTLRRVILAANYDAVHVMNYTDIDDKTIRASQAKYPDEEPVKALSKLTEHYIDIFMSDMAKIGNDTDDMTFIRATSKEAMSEMNQIIQKLFDHKIAYIADDGIYFSIKNYVESGHKYGQLVDLSDTKMSASRINNDEYDKESASDFALWKFQKEGEPAWEIKIDDKSYFGRPGWHIECSAMSALGLSGIPFDIHTGGIDLAFPHHENEIAQSLGGTDQQTYAKTFVHNEHVMVDGKKMSKSLGNFYTLKDIEKQGFDPLAFRLLVLQSHYKKQTNFSFELLTSAQNRLARWKNVANLRHQLHPSVIDDQAADNQNLPSLASSKLLINILINNLDTPQALAFIDEVFSEIESAPVSRINRDNLVQFLETIDQSLGLHLISSTPDINTEQKELIQQRRFARDAKDWQKSDDIRNELMQQGIILKDSPSHTIWQRA